MVKKSSKKKAKGAQATKKKQRGAADGGRGNALDVPARDYARLMTDPCNAPLVHPIYPGGDAGFLFRAESFRTFGNGLGTNTSGVMHWTPGYVNSTNTELIANSVDTGATTLALTAALDSPGKTFLAGTAKGVRCVAACVKITFPGAESTRSGRVHFGLTQAGMLDSGAVVAPDDVATSLQHYTRTPPETIELVWKPNIADADFCDPTEANGALIRDRRSALTVAWAGLPAGQGLTFHFTAVYEWTPATGKGVGHNALGKARSRNTMDDVIDTVIGAGFTFVRNSASAMGYGAATGAMSALSNAMGLMPAQPHTRRLAFR